MLNIGCPGCGGLLAHQIVPGRSKVETSVATCPGCCSTFRLDVAISRLSGPFLTTPKRTTGYPSRNPNAYGARLLAAIDQAKAEARAR